MCNAECLSFVEKAVNLEDVKEKAVLEVGSLDVNGTARRYVESLGPASYLGVDIVNGPGVDLLCDAAHLSARLGGEVFDLLVSTEMLEHVRDWRLVISNFKRVVRPGGLLVITTRSRGFPLHDFPADYWRFEMEDMRVLFADCEIEQLASDQSEPGLFMSARRPDRPDFMPLDLAGYALYSMQTNCRALDLEGTQQSDVGDGRTGAEAAIAELGESARGSAAESEELRAQLVALRATKTFRYSAGARRLYGALRKKFAATN
jgi:SAM-dependent methyltransferase